MNYDLKKEGVIDTLAENAGGYVSIPTQDDIRYVELLMDVCEQFGIRYYTATPKERNFVDEVTRLTWARMIEEETGIKQNVPLSFTA